MKRPQSIRRRTLLVAALAGTASAASMAGCGFTGSGGGSNGGSGSGGNNGDGDDGGSGGGGTLRLSMTPVSDLDPAIAGNASNGQILMAGLWEGLVVLDADDHTGVLPGVAEDWEISDDLLTYTFHLRSDATWSNGDPVTAQDFEFGMRRLLTPGIAGEGVPSYNHALIGIAGADAYMNGETDDFADVGAKALDDATFEITLEAPNMGFLLHLAGTAFLPLHPPTVEELGAHGWLDPEHWVSNGAYVLDSFRVNQGAVLLPNRRYWDADSYHLDRWEVTFNDGGTTADLLAYQNDEIDITGRIEDDLEAVTTSDVADELVTSPENQIRQLIVMNSRNLVLHDVRVRKALSMAIDRQALGEIGRPAVPGNSMVPDAVEDSDLRPGVVDDVDGARALLAEAGYPDGEGMPTITLLDYQASPWVEAIGQMWRENLGIDVAIDNVESGVFLEKRLELHPERYTGFYAINTSVAPPTLQTAAQRIMPAAPTMGVFGMNLVPPDVAEAFLDAQAGGASPGELLDILEGNRYEEMATAIDLAGRGLAEPDPDRARELLAESAIARDEAYVEIPVMWGGYNLLTKPRVRNFKPWPFTSVFTTKGMTIEE